MFWIWFLFYDISNAHILWDFVRNGSLLNFLFENLISKCYHKTSDLSSIFYRYTLLTIMYFRIYRTNKNIFKNHITQLKVIFFPFCTPSQIFPLWILPIYPSLRQKSYRENKRKMEYKIFYFILMLFFNHIQKSLFQRNSI